MPLRVEQEDFTRVAAALRLAGNTGLRNQVNKALRAAGKPLGQFVAVAGGRAMPQRGGLGYRVAGATVSVRATTAGGNLSGVSLSLSNRQKYDLNAMEAGQLRHPVFGHRKTWVLQSVRANAFSGPFQEGATIVRPEIVKALEQVADDIAGVTK